MLSMLMSRVRRFAQAASDRARRAGAPAGALLLAACVTAGLAGCDRAPDHLLLPGTGERDTPAIASIAGTVTVPGTTGALPAIKVWAFRDVDSTYISAYTAMQVVGNYTDPVFSVGTTSVMLQLVAGVWVDSIYLNPATMTPTAGQLEWKFVTDRDFDTTPDYGVPGVSVDGLVGSVVSGANGPEGNIVAKVTAAGPFFATIDEKKLRYSIVPWDEGPVTTIDRTTGAFTVDQLKDGAYIVVFTGPGYVTRRISNVRITGGAGVNLGTVIVRSATTAITGRVGFANPPDPLPEATVQLLTASSETPLTELTTSDAFSFSGLENGSYRVRLKAAGYTDSTVAVSYAGTVVNLGTITLAPGCSSEFNFIQVAGDLNVPLYGNFDLTKAPQMTHVGGCLWEATLNGISAGNHLFKFVTNNNFDARDYGSDEVCRTELSGTVSFVDGPGTAICVTFGETGNYKFTLNEETLTFTIVPVVVQTPGTLTGTVSFSGTPAPGLKAFVQVLEAASGNPAASDSTASRYTFSTLPAGDYKVRLSAAGYLPDTLLATVHASQTTDLGNHQLTTGFSSAFHQISVIGDFPTIGWDTANQVDMTQIAPGVWRVIVPGINGGCHYFKFRTNNNWEQPQGDPDYGGTDPLEPCVTSLTGPVASTTTVNAALQVEFPAGDAAYEFTLDEVHLTYAIVRQGAQGTGSVSGTVTFGGLTAAPFPAARVALQLQSESTDQSSTTSNTTTGAFSFTQLLPGTYKVIVSANCFTTTTVENIIVNTTPASAGSINMAAGASRFTAMQVVGTFNGFAADAPVMTPIASCVWADTIDISDVSAPTEFKFRSNNNWDEDPDYGQPGDQTDPLAGPCVLGAGGSSGNIKVQFDEAGRYRFELNELLSAYTLTRLGPITAAGTRQSGGSR